MPENQPFNSANQPVRPEQKSLPPSLGNAASREKSLDKTIADSFPSSDPPSTIPDPESQE